MQFRLGETAQTHVFISTFKDTKNMITLSQDAQSALVFFASTNAQKLEHLNKVQWPESFFLNENGDKTKIPLLAVTCRFKELIDHDIAAQFDVIVRYDQNLYHELSALIELIIALKDDHSYMWYLDKSTAGVSGFADNLWSTVQRLSTEVLKSLAIDRSRVRMNIDCLVPIVSVIENPLSPALPKTKKTAKRVRPKPLRAQRRK